MAENTATAQVDYQPATTQSERWWNAPMPERPFWQDALHIFAIFNFAIAYPVLDRTGQNGWFFVAERASTFDILLVALIPCLLIPAFFAGTLGVLELFSSRARGVVNALLIALFFIVGFQLTLTNITSATPGSATSFLAIGIALAIVLAYLYSNAIQLFATILAISIVAVPAHFLLASEVSQILFADDPDGENSVVIESPAPVVVIVYDELPLQSLLDANLQIDENRYPNFARLAADSHWFQNATTVQESTRYAIPAIATGNYPDISRTPIASEYPKNLFTLLNGSHELVVSEPATELCPTSICSHEYLVSSNLSYTIFGALTNLPAPDVVTSVNRSLLDVDLAGRVDDYTSPPAIFHHSMLPHHPWRHLPSGAIYVGSEPKRTGLGSDHLWKPDPAITIHSYQRHLLQVEYVDSLLGQLLDNLESQGTYDDALIILTADHGISFQPEQPYRHYQQSTATDIALVPFFAKLPGQTEQVVSDRNVEIIDIVPTIVDVLGIDVDWEFDGQSVFTDQPERDRKILVHNVTGEHVELPAKIEGLDKAVEHKISLFGDGEQPDGLFRYGPYGDLYGKNAATFERSENSAIRAHLDGGSIVDFDSKHSEVPALIEGSFKDDSEILHEFDHVAIAVNGVIRSVPGIFTIDDTWMFAAVVPEDSFVEGANEIELFLVSGELENVNLDRIIID
jgi:hypothetical protein